VQSARFSDERNPEYAEIVHENRKGRCDRNVKGEGIHDAVQTETGGEPQGKIDKDKFPYEKTQGIGDEKYAESLPEYRHGAGRRQKHIENQVAVEPDERRNEGVGYRVHETA